MQTGKFLFLFVTMCLARFCSLTQSQHQVKIIQGSTNNKLEVLDWGGSGQPILFLTGLGNSAHVYDDFAPRFIDKFHVYAMSRRGFGASDQPLNGYGIDTLITDVLAVCKTLHLNKVILMGHSLAGDEITAFAAKYPEKVESVVYFDAAYNHNNLEDIPFPDLPNPQNDDTASITQFNNYMASCKRILYSEVC